MSASADLVSALSTLVEIQALANAAAGGDPSQQGNALLAVAQLAAAQLTAAAGDGFLPQ